MRGIYFKDGIYVLIENVYKPDYSIIEHDDCVLNNNKKRKQSLYGGIVNLEWPNGDREDVRISVNGVFLFIPMPSYGGHTVSDWLSISLVCQYLNSIEINGVDAFVENYKKDLEFLYNKLEELKNNREEQLSSLTDDSSIKDMQSKIRNIKTMLMSILIVLFTFNSYLSAGLENQKIATVCQLIVDTMVLED
ncbi:MAG TPA: hypothetical protein GXZ90_05370 [Clostridiales bacterium]|nr:hypothetical protein [Clostridiales bacterium]